MSRNVRKCTCGHAPKEDLDQSVHSHSLIRIFTECVLVAKDARFLHADAQADLSLRWVHMSEGTFPDVSAH